MCVAGLADRENAEKSQIRHASYCRKKAQNPPRPRKRACLICTRAKTQCDTQVPACSQCLKRSVTCIYQNSLQPQHRASDISPTHQRQVQPLLPSKAVVPFLDPFWSPPPSQSTNAHASAPLSAFPDLGDVNVANGFLLQDSLVLDDFFKPAMSLHAPWGDHDSVASVHHSKPHGEGSTISNHGHSIAFPGLGLIDPLRTGPVLRAPRAFRPRKVHLRQLFLNRKYVICTLSTYPYMMLPDKGVPPFIHPQFRINEVDRDGQLPQTSLPGPLATCAGIMAMWSVKNNNNSIFIWRAIRTEQERLSHEVDSRCSSDRVH